MESCTVVARFSDPSRCVYPAGHRHSFGTQIARHIQNHLISQTNSPPEIVGLDDARKFCNLIVPKSFFLPWPLEHQGCSKPLHPEILTPPKQVRIFEKLLKHLWLKGT